MQRTTDTTLMNKCVINILPGYDSWEAKNDRRIPFKAKGGGVFRGCRLVCHQVLDDRIGVGVGGELIRVKELFMCRAVTVLRLLVPIMISLYTFIRAPKCQLCMMDRLGGSLLTTGAARKRFSHRVPSREYTFTKK